MRSFTEKLKATVVHFFDWPMKRSKSSPLKTLNKSELLPPTQSFTDELIEKSPFSFEGTLDEKQKLINIYLAFSQTPEGKKRIKSLKSVLKTPIKMYFNEGLRQLNQAGSYSSFKHEIRLSPHTEKNFNLILRHEIDHVLDYISPEYRGEARSIGQEFYMDKLTEVKAIANDVEMDFNHNYGELPPLVQFYQERLNQAAKEIPDAPNKESKIRNQAKGDVIKLLWSGGEQLSNDTELKKVVQSWTETYNAQAFKNAKLFNMVVFKRMPEADLKAFVKKMTQIMDIPVDADFLMQNQHDGWRMTGGTLSITNNSLLFQEKDHTVCWRVTDEALKYVETSPQGSCVQDFEQNKVMYEGKMCRTYGTHLSKQHMRYSNGAEEIKIFDAENQNNYTVRTILPNGQELKLLQVLNNQPLNGVSVHVNDAEKTTVFKKYQDGQLSESLIFGENMMIVSKEGKDIHFSKLDDEIIRGDGQEQCREGDLQMCWEKLKMDYFKSYLNISTQEQERNFSVPKDQNRLTEQLRKCSQKNNSLNQLSQKPLTQEKKESMHSMNQSVFLKRLSGKMEK